MGNLAVFLQRAFTEACPAGWTCRSEVAIVRPEIASLLGYDPRADLLLERSDRSRRLWIEFEVSRADPVANEAKFATAHLFEPRLESDRFLAMVSPHVTRGRRNLGAATIALLRRVGIHAFQTTLFPHLAPEEVKRLNHRSLIELAAETIDVAPEIVRAMEVTTPLARGDAAHSLHYAGDLLDAMLNLARWNDDLATVPGRALWGRRTVTYFVFDGARSFAPAKFCAYVAIPEREGATTSTAPHAGMTMEVYAALDDREPTFDGHKARTHLVRNLGMSERLPADEETREAFALWLRLHAGAIGVHPRGPVMLVPPRWY